MAEKQEMAYEESEDEGDAQIEVSAPAVAEKKGPEAPAQRHKKLADRNVVFVGKKPTMSYVLAVVTQFSDGMNEVHIMARGRSISRAVDVAEVVRNRFVQGAKTSVNIDTEEIIDDNNNKLNVSTIDIVLNK